MFKKKNLQRSSFPSSAQYEPAYLQVETPGRNIPRVCYELNNSQSLDTAGVGSNFI